MRMCGDSRRIAARALGDDLLGQDVEWGHGRKDAVETATVNGANDGRALDELVA